MVLHPENLEAMSEEIRHLGKLDQSNDEATVS